MDHQPKSERGRGRGRGGGRGGQTKEKAEPEEDKKVSFSSGSVARNIRKLVEGNSVLARRLADAWVVGGYTLNFGKPRPRGLYAIYFPTLTTVTSASACPGGLKEKIVSEETKWIGAEVYATVRDSSSEPLSSLGRDVYVFTGLDASRAEKLFAAVASKCDFVSLGESFPGRGTGIPTRSSDGSPDLLDGFYIIHPSAEDERMQKSPLRPISCKNFRTSTDREVFAAKTLYTAVEGMDF